MIKDNAVLGMYITRGFGDGRWKYSTEIQKRMKDNYFTRSPHLGSLTPPYLTAKPVVSLTEVRPGKGFMILASDGLWDRMKSEQAVILVGKWLDKKAKREFGVKEVPKQSTYLQQIGSDLPLRSQEACWEVRTESITVVDDNAATNLARNALGGADEELFRGMLTFRVPFSRNIR
jgi:pyruvate dehydrogenase phosphatase